LSSVLINRQPGSHLDPKLRDVAIGDDVFIGSVLAGFVQHPDDEGKQMPVLRDGFVIAPAEPFTEREQKLP